MKKKTIAALIRAEKKSIIREIKKKWEKIMQMIEKV